MNSPEQTEPPSRSRGSRGHRVPDDANDLRGFHFKRLMRKPLTWILIGGADRGRPSSPA